MLMLLAQIDVGRELRQRAMWYRSLALRSSDPDITHMLEWTCPGKVEGHVLTL